MASWEVNVISSRLEIRLRAQPRHDDLLRRDRAVEPLPLVLPDDVELLTRVLEDELAHR